MQLTVQMVEDEPRVHDLMLAERLGFERPRTIRQLIERNRVALERHGEVCCTVQQTTPLGGRPSTEYWLNEEQALLICTKSGTAVAEEITSEVIKVFVAWRHDKLGPVSSHVTLTSIRESIGELFDEKLEPVHRKMEHMQWQMSDLDAKVVFVSRRVDDIVPRRDFLDDAKKQFKCVAAQKYNNECPSCRGVKLDQCQYDFDHFLGRELNGSEHGWIVCHKCNSRMATDTLFKASRRAHFEVFQELRRQMFGNRAPSKPRKGSPTSSSGNQSEMKF